MYKFKYREIHNTLTGELTVVHVRTFINFLTSEFGSSTRGEREREWERETILKSLSYHTILTKLKCSAHLVDRDQKNLTVRLNGRNPNFSTPWSELNFYCLSTWPKVDYQLDRSPFDNQQGCSSVKTQLTCFSKYLNSPPIASGHDVIHTPALFSIWGLLWQLWLSYPLRTSVNCTQCLCTWTKSRIV